MTNISLARTAAALDVDDEYAERVALAVGDAALADELLDWDELEEHARNQLRRRSRDGLG